MKEKRRRTLRFCLRLMAASSFLPFTFPFAKKEEEEEKSRLPPH
jgi:hypothetical protein